MRGRIEDGPILRKMRTAQSAIAVLEDYIYSREETDEKTQKAGEISVVIETTMENLEKRKKADEWYLAAMERVLSHLPNREQEESEEYFQYRLRMTRHKVDEFIQEIMRKEEEDNAKEENVPSN